MGQKCKLCEYYTHNSTLNEHLFTCVLGVPLYSDVAPKFIVLETKNDINYLMHIYHIICHIPNIFCFKFPKQLILSGDKIDGYKFSDKGLCFVNIDCECVSFQVIIDRIKQQLVKCSLCEMNYECAPTKEIIYAHFNKYH